MTAGRRAVLVALAVAVASPLARSAGAARKAAGPVANFLVEWRIEPIAAAGAANGDVVIGTRDAAAGRSGFGPGAVVTGTAHPVSPQAVRVANGKEAALQFDTARGRTVYDMAWSAQAEGGPVAAAGASRARGISSHEITLHRIDGLRVTPHWTRGDALSLDLELTHAGPARGGDEDTTQAVAFRSTVQIGFDEWQGVARVGDTDELQVRVRWR